MTVGELRTIIKDIPDTFPIYKLCGYGYDVWTREPHIRIEKDHISIDCTEGMN